MSFPAAKPSVSLAHRALARALPPARMNKKIPAFAVIFSLLFHSAAFAATPADLEPSAQVSQSLLQKARATFAALSASERQRLKDLAADALDRAYDTIAQANPAEIEKFKARLEDRIGTADFDAEASRLTFATPDDGDRDALVARLSADLEHRSERVLAKVDALTQDRLLELVDHLRTELRAGDGDEKADTTWDKIADIPGDLILGGLFLSMTIGLAFPILEPVFFAMVGAGVGVGLVISWLDQILH
jgi:hypothetical protein